MKFLNFETVSANSLFSASVSETDINADGQNFTPTAIPFAAACSIFSLKLPSL